MYIILNKNSYRKSKLEFKPFSEKFLENVRLIRNKQKKILRQNNIISKKEQNNYFSKNIKTDFKSLRPKNILLLIFKGKNLVGYCGLTNLDWSNKRAELSFILDSKYNKKKIFLDIFQNSLELLQEILFKELKFKKFFSETYEFRKDVISFLISNNFVIEGCLKNHIYKNGKFYNSILLGKDNYNFVIDHCNLLITSSSNKSSLVVLAKNSLRKIAKRSKVFCSDKDQEVVTKYLSDGFIKLPKLEKKNLKIICKKLKQKGINFVLPTRSSELLFWSKNKTFFKKNKIKVIVSNFKSIQFCLDKYSFYLFLKKNKILTPETCLQKNKFKNFIKKPRFGAGGKDFLQKGNNKSVQIYQERVSGKEISADCWISKDKKSYSIMLRNRLRIKNGESEISNFFLNKNISKVVKLALKKLNLTGIVNLQGFIKKKKFYIFDCNPRVGGSMSFSHMNGLDFLNWSILEEDGVSPKIKIIQTMKKNKKLFKIKKTYSVDDIYI